MNQPVRPIDLARAALALGTRHPAQAIIQGLATYLRVQRRLADWPFLRSAIRTLGEERGDIRLEVAAPLPVTTERSLRDLCRRQWPNHAIAITVNPNLGGGFRLHAGPRTYDGSFITTLTHLKQQLEAYHG
ncbi:F0F1 ATP synthase subunit delta [Candidatus Berkelbacteria bacterium]|nr:F0F1 ATP synthase subunit delta [Candidatus Berkelbacteria bacterium]